MSPFVQSDNFSFSFDSS